VTSKNKTKQNKEVGSSSHNGSPSFDKIQNQQWQQWFKHEIFHKGPPTPAPKNDLTIHGAMPHVKVKTSLMRINDSGFILHVSV
jgi:hypothetical protein